MNIEFCLPKSFSWKDVPLEKMDGETGFTIIKTQLLGNIKIREVEYSINYSADHWCNKGHVVYILQGELKIEHKEGEIHFLKSGMTYIIGDNTMPHKVLSTLGAMVLIID
jgi:hypothetical protein